MILVETIGGSAGCYTVSALRLGVTIRANLSIVAESLPPAPVDVHHERCDERKQNGVHYEDRCFSSARWDAGQDSGHERNEEHCSNTTTHEVHLLI